VIKIHGTRRKKQENCRIRSFLICTLHILLLLLWWSNLGGCDVRGMEEIGNSYKIVVKKSKEKVNLIDLGLDGKIIFKHIL
jgi:hypothetical protein